MKITNNENNKITEKAEKEFLRLWHAYHAKYKIPYSHDEARDMFVKSIVYFLGGYIIVSIPQNELSEGWLTWELAQDRYKVTRFGCIWKEEN